MVKGVKVSCLDGIEEGYSIEKRDTYYQMTINVSAQNIDEVFRSLCLKVKEPGFLLIEHASSVDIEEELRKSDTDPMHKDIHYLDGLGIESFFKIYDKYHELLINDGMVNFGFGSHSDIDEVYVGTYKIFTIFTDEPEKYIHVLNDIGIPKKETLKTVWNNISKDTPASRVRINHNGMDIYEMVDLLSKEGLYLAERRED